MTLPPAPEWMADAACKGLAFDGMDPWHSEQHEQGLVILAKRICKSCTVREACREYGETIPGADGIWGGRSKRNARREGRE